MPKKPASERAYTSWISEEKWQVIYARVPLQISPYRYQRHLRNLGRRVRSLLAEDRRRRAMDAGTVVETLLTYDPPLIKEARSQI